jgi:hypothetical protein
MSKAAAAIKRRGEAQLANLSALDLDALKRAEAIARRDPERVKQFDSMLSNVLLDNTWFEVAHLAAYICQTDSLKLHEEPPMHMDENDPDDVGEEARQLLCRMLAAGLSRYEPDPVLALAKKSRRRNAKPQR